MSQTEHQQLTTEDLASAAPTEEDAARHPAEREATGGAAGAETEPAGVGTDAPAGDDIRGRRYDEAYARQYGQSPGQPQEDIDPNEDPAARPPVRGEQQAFGPTERPTSGSMGDWMAPNSAAPLGVPATGSGGAPWSPEEPATTTAAPAASAAAEAPSPEPDGDKNDSGTHGLLSDTQDYDQRWQQIQTGFVDEPRHAVEQADALVAEVIQQLARSFADERSRLERAWAGGDTPSTEDLRVSLQRYREFFQVLLRS